MTDDLDDIWDRLQAELRRSVTEADFEIWLAPLRPLDHDGAVLTLQGPVGLTALVAQRFGRLLDAAAAAVLGPGTTVLVRPAGARPRTDRQRDPSPPPRDRSDPRDPPTRLESHPLNPKFTFEQFVIGDANRFAHAAALAVAELPGQAYNPLFIYGPPGVGKTHLLHAIGNYVQRYGGGMTVRYTTVEAFTNDFIGALRGGGIERFKDQYRRTDVLLIDDIQFLEQKAKTEEEFFHTFNALQEIGSQLVLTSDRMPRDLDALHARLRERFESGLVADICAPDRNTRIGVLRKRAQQDRLVLSDHDAIEAIADRVTTNVRALEGALIRVVAFASLERSPITGELAGRVLDTLYPRARKARRIDVAQIQKLVCDNFGLTREELLGSDRSVRVSWPRQVAMYLAREHTDATLPAIGRSFGGKNHTTVLYACRRTAERVASDPAALATVKDLASRLTSCDADRTD